MKKLPLLIFLVLFFGNLRGQITAEFTSFPFSNCGGSLSPHVTVSFLDQSISSGGNITNWDWDFGDFQTSIISSPMHTYPLAGNYTVCLTVTNSANESDTECKTNYVSISDIPTCNILPPDILTCINSEVTLDGSLSTFGPNIAYEWRNANFEILGNDPNLNVTSAGFYSLNVSETIHGCSAEATVEVTGDFELPIIHLPSSTLNDTIYNCQENIYFSADLVDPSCTNCYIEIRDANFELICNSLPCVMDIGQLASMGIFPQSPYSILATNNNNGCYVEEFLPDPPSQNLTVSNSITNESCNNNADGSIDLTISGTGTPYTFDWNDLPGTNDVLDRTGLTAGNYTLHITDAVGCDVSGPDGFLYEVKSYPIADVSASDLTDTLTCTTPTVGPFILDGSNSSSGPNIIYSWYDSNNNLISDSIIVEVNPFPLDDYYLVVTDTLLQCSNTAYAVFTIVQDVVSPTVNLNLIPTEITCLNPTVTIDGSGSSTGSNITYAWMYDGVALSGETSPILLASQPGTYILIVTDINNGCSATSDVFISENTTPPTVDAGTDLVLTCTNASVDLDGTGSSTSGNITYEWVGPNNNVISLTQNAVATQPGVYTLIVTDTDNGCTASDEVLVTEDTNVPTVNISATTLVCPGTPVIIDMIPGCVNCTIEILDNMGNLVCNTLPCQIDPADGPFQITITDQITGCQNVEDFSISVPNPIEITSVTITNPSCFGENDGAIDLEVIGGSPPYFYSWSTGLQTTGDIVNLEGGIHTVTITDANGCELVESFEVIPPDILEITNAAITNVSCTATNDGSIDLTISGGTGMYSYTWSNGVTSNILSDLFPGNYTVTITDDNGCAVVSPEYTIIQNACFNFANDTTICVGETVSLSNDLPIAGWNYEWAPSVFLNDPSISNPIAAPSETVVFFLTITDGSGMVIFSGEGPTITVQNYMDFGLLDFSNAPLCEDDTLELYGNLGTTFLWTGPNSYTSTNMNPTINNVTEFDSGIYNLTITDDFGCTATADVDVFIDDDCVYPGDTDTNMVVNNFDLLNIGLAYDSVGTTRENASFDWFGQPSVDWSQSTPTSNVNYKHIDADGNGIIEAADTVAITQNFGLTYNFSSPVDNQFTDLPPTDGFTIVTPFYVEPDTLVEGETIALDIILGDVTNIVTGLYGIGFTIEYDSSVVVPGSASIDFSNCWLGDVNADAISIQFDFHNPGRIDAAITRIDGVEMDGYGIFGELIITLEDDILLWNGNSNSFNGNTTTDVSADFTITNYHLINFSQEEIIVQGTTTTSPVEGTTSLDFIELNELISVFPNPANDLFYIASQKINIDRVRIFSATGELKSVKTKTGNSLEFSTKELSSGIYFIEIQTREGIVTKKLSIVK